MHASATFASRDYGATLLRVSLGTMWIAHSLLKLFVFTLAGTAQYFASVGYPAFLAYPVFCTELLGGIALILGIYARQVSLMLVPIMAAATLVHVPNGWVFTSQGRLGISGVPDRSLRRAVAHRRWGVCTSPQQPVRAGWRTRGTGAARVCHRRGALIRPDSPQALVNGGRFQETAHGHGALPVRRRTDQGHEPGEGGEDVIGCCNIARRRSIRIAARMAHVVDSLHTRRQGHRRIQD